MFIFLAKYKCKFSFFQSVSYCNCVFQLMDLEIFIILVGWIAFGTNIRFVRSSYKINYLKFWWFSNFWGASLVDYSWVHSFGKVSFVLCDEHGYCTYWRKVVKGWPNMLFPPMRSSKLGVKLSTKKAFRGNVSGVIFTSKLGFLVTFNAGIYSLSLKGYCIVLLDRRLYSILVGVKLPSTNFLLKQEFYQLWMFLLVSLFQIQMFFEVWTECFGLFLD